MKNKKTQLKESSDLRSQAEAQLNQGRSDPITAEDVTDERRLLHELQVHQIELEMQNEELLRAKLEAEEALARYSDLYEFAPIGLFTIDTFGQILEVNLTGAALLGMERHFLLKKRFDQFVAPEDRPSLEHLCQQAFRTGVKQTCELKLITSEGSETYVRIEGTVTNDSLLNERKFRLAVIDITARKRAEDALSEREAKYRLLAENTADVIWILDVGSMRFTYVSPSVERLRGYTPEEVLAQSFDEFLTPSSAAMIRALLAKRVPAFLGGDLSAVTETRNVEIPRKDGSIVWAEAVTTLFKSSEGTVKILGATRDITERKRAEEALRESEKRYRDLVENANSIIIRMDIEGKISYFNNYAQKFFGYSFEEMLGKDVKILIPPIENGSGRSLNEMADNILRNPDDFVDNINENIRKNGESVWISWRNKAIRNANGDIVGNLAIGQDITERKRAAESLQVSETRYRSLFNSMSEGFALHEIICDEDGEPIDYRFLDINPAFEKLTGLNREDVIGKTHNEVIPGDDPSWVKEYGVVAITGESARFENYSPTLKRHYGVFAYRPAPRQFAVIFMDITERKHREEQIAKLTRLYAVLSQVNEAIVRIRDEKSLFSEVCGIVTGEGDFLLVWIGQVKEQQVVPVAWSGPAADYLKEIKVEVEGDLGKGPTGTCIREDRPVINNDFLTNPATSPWREQAKRYGFRASAAFPLRRQGKPIGAFTLYSSDPGTFDEEQVGLLESLASDISYALDAIDQESLRAQAEQVLTKSRDELEQRVQERTVELTHTKEELELMNEQLQVELEQHRKLEADLMEAKDVAEEAVEAKAAFLANMSHELRTPMNAVIGFTSLLLDEPLTSEQKDCIEGIRDGGQALLGLINDILDFSKADKEKVKLERQPFSLKHCIESSLDMVASQANQKGLNLSYTIGYGTPDTILGDPGRLRQILVNLLGNAVKFTDEGDVSVFVSSKNAKGSMREILFAVKDTGIGIPPEKLDKIFEPFTQVERVISRKRDGVGLGLAISKKLVELMGGKIWAESLPGQGTTLQFTIEAEIIPGGYQDLGAADEAAFPESFAEQNPLTHIPHFYPLP